MEDEKIVKAMLPDLAKNWEIKPGNFNEDMDEEFLLGLLETRIAEMLKYDLSRLVNAMYRLDISEKNFHGAMAKGSDKEKVAVLAKLVLEREYQKAETRAKYK